MILGFFLANLRSKKKRSERILSGSCSPNWPFTFPDEGENGNQRGLFGGVMFLC